MNKLEILLKQWKEGRVLNKDLALCLSYINALNTEKVRHETRVSHSEGTDTTPRENDSAEPKRSKVKRL
jgi:hypothetical protein